MKKIILLLMIVFSLFIFYLTYNMVESNKIYEKVDVDYDELLYYKLYAISTSYTEMFEDLVELKKQENLNADKVLSITGVKCKSKDYIKCVTDFYDLPKYMDSEKEKILELRQSVSQERANITSNIIYYLDDIKRLNIDGDRYEVYEKYNVLKNNLEEALTDYKKKK